MSLEDKILNVIKNDVNNIGILLKEVKYEQEKGVYYLRIFIDKEPFITIDDCVLVTNTINPILDKIDIIDNSYMLDVSSIEKGGNYE